MNVARFGAQEANRRATPDPMEPLEVPVGLDVKLFTQKVLDAARAGDGDPFEGDKLPPLEVIEPYKALMPAVRAARVSSPWDPADAGSNNWVVSGSRTPSGIPILANDPHRRIEMPALRYFVHLNAPGWNVIGAGEPPFVGVDAGHNDRMAWGFTFAGTDMVDLYVEELHAEQPNMVRWQDGWEPLRIIREEIRIKGQAPRTVELKFSRHGPVFYEDTVNRRAYAVRSVVQEPGTAAYFGSFKLAQARNCTDFFDRAMSWKVPTHNLICGDAEGNIALQVSGLTPDRDGWNGRLPVPGTGKYEWKGFRSDLPREMNPARGYIATANDNTHPAGIQGPAGLLSFHRRCRDLADHAAPPDPQLGQDPLCRGPRADSAGRVLAHGRARHPALSGVDRQGPGSRTRAGDDCGMGQDPHERIHGGCDLRPLGGHRRR